MCSPSQRLRKQKKCTNLAQPAEPLIFLVRHKSVSLKINQFNSIKNCTNTYGKKWIFNLKFKKNNITISIPLLTSSSCEIILINILMSLSLNERGMWLPKQMAVTDCIPRLRISTQVEAA